MLNDKEQHSEQTFGNGSQQNQESPSKGYQQEYAPHIIQIYKFYEDPLPYFKRVLENKRITLTDLAMAREAKK